jgi:hypothetical protein
MRRSARGSRRCSSGPQGPEAQPRAGVERSAEALRDPKSSDVRIKSFQNQSSGFKIGFQNRVSKSGFKIGFQNYVPRDLRRAKSLTRNLRFWASYLGSYLCTNIDAHFITP